MRVVDQADRPVRVDAEVNSIPGVRRVASQGRRAPGLQGLPVVEAEHVRAAPSNEHQPRIDDPWRRRRRRDLAVALVGADRRCGVRDPEKGIDTNF